MKLQDLLQKQLIPTWRILNAHTDTYDFLRRNRKVPPLELKISSLGTKKFQEGNCFWNSYILWNQYDSVTTSLGTHGLYLARGRPLYQRLQHRGFNGDGRPLTRHEPSVPTWRSDGVLLVSVYYNGRSDRASVVSKVTALWF